MPSHVASLDPGRVAVVGLGNVGWTFVDARLLSDLAPEIALIDAKAEGEAPDLNHAVPFTDLSEVWAGDYSDCADAPITRLAAVAPQLPGETRFDIVQKISQHLLWRCR